MNEASLTAFLRQKRKKNVQEVFLMAATWGNFEPFSDARKVGAPVETRLLSLIIMAAAPPVGAP